MAGMLLSMSISNFILIESAEIDLGRGLTVITGETGAGKSMIIQALFFGMGERADAGIIRHGCDEAHVTLRFVTTTGELICDRRFTRSGKSRVTINGATSSVTELKQLMSSMIDVVSQFDQQRLLNPDSHLDVMDACAGAEVERANYGTAYAAWNGARRALSLRESQLAEARTQEEFLRYQLEELRKAALKPNEEDQLIADRDRVRHRAQWESRLQKCDDLVSGDAGLERTLTQVTPLAPDSATELVQQMQVLAAELAQIVAREVDTLSNAPADLDAIESRLFILQQLSRKYKTDADGLIAKRDAIAEQLRLLDLGEEGLDDLRATAVQCEKILIDAGKFLTQVRRKATKPLMTGVQKVLAEVGMHNATLHVQWRELPVNEATARGMDAVEFLISTNTGEPLLPMAQIASGGELSRILLAIQCVVTQNPSLQVYVFDEVDTGISGRVATAVGSVLQRLAARTQVLCITHLPQVAAFGHAHLQVSKEETRGRTRTTIDTVPGAQRREAIARLLSGSQLTQTALQHADELLTQAHNI
jgi:DNA repair protein RecN (Recombination protein N)